MVHEIEQILHSWYSVTIVCTCGAKFVGSSYKAEHNSLNEREALAKFRPHAIREDISYYLPIS